ncbi:hypothetical protein PO124_15510 [Bacillus licheniformis]|nr:hypothetical protein [Bacillus licheniformis]
MVPWRCRHIVVEKHPPRNGVNDPGLHTDILNALETTVKHGLGNNRSFCHGDFGQLEILRGFREEFSELNTIIQNTEDRLLTYFKKSIQ